MCYIHQPKYDCIFLPVTKPKVLSIIFFHFQGPTHNPEPPKPVTPQHGDTEICGFYRKVGACRFGDRSVVMRLIFIVRHSLFVCVGCSINIVKANTLMYDESSALNLIYSFTFMLYSLCATVYLRCIS